MGAKELSVEDFLGHEGSARGGGSFLGNWKDPKRSGKGFIEVWLHRKCAFSVALWRHNVPKPDVVEDKQTREPKRVIWTDRLLCSESEDVLKYQKRRDKQTGERDAPPESCPICRMIEHVYQLVRAGEVDWLAEIFRFDVGDGKPQVLHAAGIYGGFDDKVPPDMKRKANDAGVFFDRAWAEKWSAGLNYAFRVVDNGDPKSGVQIAVEPGLLGDKVKAEIRKAMMPGVLGKDRGNPVLNPYCIRWDYYPNEREFQKRYDATRMEGIKITPDIEKLITESQPPDLNKLTEPPAWDAVRSRLERAALIDLPWDDFFGSEVKNEDKKAAPKISSASVRVPIPAGSTLGREIMKKVAPAEELFACDNDACGKPVRATDKKCPHCGFVYEVEVAPAPPALPKRSTAGKAAPKVEKPAPRAAPPKINTTAPEPAPVDESWMAADPGDEIPF